MAKYIKYSVLEIPNMNISLGENATLTINGNPLVAKIENAFSVDLVRCEDCRFREEGRYFCSKLNRGVAWRDFCSWGEEEEEDD